MEESGKAATYVMNSTQGLPFFSFIVFLLRYPSHDNYALPDPCHIYIYILSVYRKQTHSHILNYHSNHPNNRNKWYIRLPFSGAKIHCSTLVVKPQENFHWSIFQWNRYPKTSFEERTKEHNRTEKRLRHTSGT